MAQLQVEGVIGSGNTGNILRAVYRLPKGHKVRFAVKVVKPSLNKEADALLKGEPHILQLLKGHANVVEIQTIKPQPVMSMPQKPVSSWLEGEPSAPQDLLMLLPELDGGSLDDLVETQGKLSEPQALKILNGLCSGLCHVHSHGIIHRLARCAILTASLLCHCTRLSNVCHGKVL